MELIRYRLTKPMQEVTLCPLGDIQWAGDEEDLAYSRLLAHLRWCQKQPTPLYLGTGDYIDFASPSNRKILEHGGLYDTAQKVIADASKALVDDLIRRALTPTIGHWLTLVQGHHHHLVTLGKRKDGTAIHEDSDVYLAKQMQCAYGDEFALVQLQWPGGGKFSVVVLHGKGSSVFPWGPLNQLWRLVPNFSVDLLLSGHHTKVAMAGTDRLTIPDTGTKMHHRTVKIVGTGGWTRGYRIGQPTYVSKAGLTPVALGQPVIHLRPVMWEGQWEPGMTVEG